MILIPTTMVGIVFVIMDGLVMLIFVRDVIQLVASVKDPRIINA